MGVRIAVVAFVAALVLSLAALGVGAYALTHKAQTNASFSKELRDGLVESCETTHKVLVEGIQGELLSVDDPRIPEIFPDVPKAVADRIIREGDREKRERIDQIRPSGCEAQYPKP